MNAWAAIRTFLRRAFTENIRLKVIGLVSSIGLFMIVRGTEDHQVTVPVLLRAPEAGDRMLVSEVPDEIRVTLQGARSILNSVERDGLAPIEMTPSEANQHYYYINTDNLGLPAGATVVRVAPEAIPLRWARRDSQRRRVEPFLDGTVAEGHVVAGTTVEPGSVDIRGAVREINRLERIRTQSVDIDGLEVGEHERRVPLMPLPEHVAYTETTAVVVTIVVEEEAGNRLFEDVEVSVIGSTQVTLRPPRIDVRVAGSRARVNELDANRVIAFVDVTDMNVEAGAQALVVQLRPLPEAMTATADPSEILVVP